jgi:hypothetical protein
MKMKYLKFTIKKKNKNWWWKNGEKENEEENLSIKVE